jgi:DNA polymerase-3 subunit epsilon
MLINSFENQSNLVEWFEHSNHYSVVVTRHKDLKRTEYKIQKNDYVYDMLKVKGSVTALVTCAKSLADNFPPTTNTDNKTVADGEQVGVVISEGDALLPTVATPTSGDTLFIDTETTGLSSHDEIVEISIVDINEQILFTSLIKPTKRIPQSATNIHGITNDMVAKSPTFYQIYPKLQKLIQGKTCVFYNAELDLSKIVNSYRKSFDKDNPILSDGFRHSYANYLLFKGAKTFCLMDFYSNWANRRRWQTLMSACHQMHVVTSDVKNHRATGDAIKTARLYRALQAKGAL